MNTQVTGETIRDAHLSFALIVDLIITLGLISAVRVFIKGSVGQRLLIRA